MKFIRSIINTIHTDLKEHIVKVAIVLGILATVYLISENIFVSFIVAAVCAVMLLHWDSRIFFVFGLIFLVFCPFLLAFEKKTVAEEMAVYAYYMLALGVIMQIVHHVREHLEEGRERKKQKAFLAHREYWTKRKLALWSIVVAGFTFAISAACFYVFYGKIKDQLSENKAQFMEFVQKTEKEIKEIPKEVSRDDLVTSSDTPKVVEVINEPGDWETVKVFVINTTPEKGLENKVADEFKKLGSLNVFVSHVTSTPAEVTTIDYCSDCFNVAQELAVGLPLSKGLIITQQEGLDNQITVQLGTDQLSVKE